MNEKSNNITQIKQYEKYVFEYYLVTQINSELDKDQLIEIRKKPIFDLETLLVWSNPTSQQKELPSVLLDFEKWIFPNGLNVVNEQTSKYTQLEEFHNNPQSKLGSNLHEINYFVITDLETSYKYYCTCAFFYEKVVLVDKEENGHCMFIPRSHVVMSRVPFFNAQKNLIGFLLHVHRGRQNMEQDRIIQITKGDLIYGIEQSKLFDYYIQFVFEKCQLREENERVQLNFHSTEKQWKGIYIPNLLSTQIFNYSKSKLPFIVGLHRDVYKAIADLIKFPRLSRNYLIHKIHILIGDIKFYEDIFNGLIKDCFRATEFQDEYIQQSREKQYGYIFGAVLSFIEDSTKLNIGGRSFSDSKLILERMKEIEENQDKQIEFQITGSTQKKRIINSDEGMIEYIESIYQTSNNNNITHPKKDSILEKTGTSHGISSYLSSFLNTPIDFYKEVIRTPSSSIIRVRKGLSRTYTLNSTDIFKDDPHPPFLSKDQFYVQYIENKKKRQTPEPTNPKSNNTEQFNDNQWLIITSPNEDIESDPQRKGSKSIGPGSSRQDIRTLSLFDKKDLLHKYQKQDEDEFINFKLHEGLSTVIEIQSAYSGLPSKSNNYNRKNSLKEFVKINYQLLQNPNKEEIHKFQSRSSSTGANAGNMFCSEEISEIDQEDE